jgi:hypothetical protein
MKHLFLVAFMTFSTSLIAANGEVSGGYCEHQENGVPTFSFYCDGEFPNEVVESVNCGDGEDGTACIVNFANGTSSEGQVDSGGIERPRLMDTKR